MLKKIGNNPISKNLARILSEPSLADNLELIEKETGLSKMTVRHWISGHRKPQLANLQKIADLFHFDIYILFDNPTEEELLPEQKEIMEMIARIRKKDVLEAIRTIARMGLLDKMDKGE